MKSNCTYLVFINFFSSGTTTSWNIRQNRNLFLKLKPNLGLYHVVLTTLKNLLQKIKLLLKRMNGQIAKRMIPCLKWTICNRRRKVCVNFKTNTVNPNIVVYRYRNLKYSEIDLKLTEYQSLLEKRVYLLSYVDIFFKRRIVMVETTVHN